MDIVVKGRRTEVSETFRDLATEKLARVRKLDPKVIRIDVELCRETNPRQSGSCERVELTCHSRGPVIRAEAAAPDAHAALDVALDRLEARLRRAADRRRIHHGNRTPVSVAAATAAVAEPAAAARFEPPATAAADPAADGAGVPNGSARVVQADGPFVVREKVHAAEPMTLDQALFEMELVGHDFFLFVDRQSGDPAVVYRRRGYDYGVIRLGRSGRASRDELVTPPETPAGG